MGVDDVPCSRENSICATAIYATESFFVEDLHKDQAFSNNPYVTGPAAGRSYAGVPLRPTNPTLPGIGTLAVMDRSPRTFTDQELALLGDIADVVCAVIRSRRIDPSPGNATTTDYNNGTDVGNGQHQQVERMVGIGSWFMDFKTERLTWSDQVFRTHDLPVGAEPLLDVALSFYPAFKKREIRNGFYQARTLGKPFDVESEFTTATGRVRRVRSMGEPRIVGGHIVGLTGVFQDVTERYDREKSLRENASTDALTGLSNRRGFDEKFESVFASVKSGGGTLTLVLLDLDGLKRVNDTLGHAAGDEVLRNIAQVLQTAPFNELYSARLGGDEFALVVDDVAMFGGIQALVATVLRKVCYEIERNGIRYSVSTCVGASKMPSEATQASEFFQQADSALYEAKRIERETGKLFGHSPIISASSA